MDFEKNMARLHEISSKMQDSSITLEESMKLYTEAAELSNSLEKYIAEAKAKIESMELKNEQN